MAIRHAPLIVGLALIAACAQVPPAPAPVPAPPPAPAPEPPPPPPPPPPPVTPVTIREAQVLAEKTIVPLLELGNEEQARVELDRASQKDPNSKLVANLMRQLSDDPVAMLGRESFTYTIRPNDTLSSIAAVYLKDKYLFYALARYNGIAVPKQIAAGQQIKVPGKAGTVVPKAPPPAKVDASAAAATDPAPTAPTPPPPPAPAPLPPPPPPAPVPVPPSPGEQALQAGIAAERAGILDRALADYQRAAAAGQPDADARVASVRGKLKAGYARDARTARANQNLDAAIAAWDHVLALDPSDEPAKRERTQAVELKTKLDQQRRSDPSK